MKTVFSALPGILSPRGHLWINTQFIEQVADLMHDTAFFIKDSEGCYVVVNQSLVERHGLNDKAQMIGKRPCEVCPGDFGRIPTEQDAQVLRTGKPIIERLEMFWRKPNVPVWGLTSKIPVRDDNGRVTGLIGISKDLTALVNRDDVPPGVAKALRYLERSFDEAISPSALAKKAGMSAARFARVIKRIHGISPMQLITKVRITAGSRLLRETDSSIAEIALNCGFADHSAFTRAFRAVTSYSPSEYRRQKQAE
ncbi:MAG: AraC family transcriptional regulator [Prosthecobacter sp.]|nr:AraC family transcriptional regulator [Prosthecobacter sp.]